MQAMFYARSQAVQTLFGDPSDVPDTNAELQDAIACESSEGDPIPVVLDNEQFITMKQHRAEGRLPECIQLAEI